MTGAIKYVRREGRYVMKYYVVVISIWRPPSDFPQYRQTWDFNAHHQGWGDVSCNRLGELMFNDLVTKDIKVVNNNTPTRKNHIIDLTLVSSSICGKVRQWKVAEEVSLNTDHKLVSFQLGDMEVEEISERWDFSKTNWSEWEKGCEEKLKSGLVTVIQVQI